MLCFMFIFHPTVGAQGNQTRDSDHIADPDKNLKYQGSDVPDRITTSYCLIWSIEPYKNFSHRRAIAF